MVCLFILAALISLVFFVTNRPRILIIESESIGSHRSRLFREGWNESMRNKHLLAKVSWYSLEQDLHPDSQTTSMGAIRTVEQEDPDLVILLDDSANERVGSVLAKDKKKQLLFIGIDQSPDYYGYSQQDHITGIVEQLRLEPFHELLEILYPGVTLKYGVIGVDSPKGRARLKQIEGCPWSHHVLKDVTLVSTFSEWQDFVRTHQALDVLLVLNLDALPSHSGGEKVIPISEIVDWTEMNSKPLPVGVEANYVTSGGGLAFEVSPRHFGEAASNLTKEWMNLSGEKVPNISYTTDFQVALCRARLAFRKINVPTIYEESARLAGTLYP